MYQWFNHEVEEKWRKGIPLKGPPSNSHKGGAYGVTNSAAARQHKFETRRVKAHEFKVADQLTMIRRGEGTLEVD
jgi:hypothetical protein